MKASLGAISTALLASVIASVSGCGSDPATDTTHETSDPTYDQVVAADSPVVYLPLSSGTYAGTSTAATTTSMPNGDLAVVFDGVNQYLEAADQDALSISTTGRLTIEAWIRPDTLEFPNDEGSGYVHWLGKGVAGQHEYVLRMYSFTNTEMPSRPNRISGYAFNLAGGLGSGSYFQDTVTAGEWLHIAVVYDTIDTSATYPTGYVKIYKNGVLRDTTGMDQYAVVPANGTAPLRIGTRNLTSYFKGAIGKVAIYGAALGDSTILGRYTLMTSD